MMTKTQATLYSTTTIDGLSWPSSLETSRKELITPWVMDGAKSHIQNVDASVAALQVEDHVLPVSVANLDDTGCYVASPFSQFVTYATEHLNKSLSKKVLGPVQFLLKGWGGVLRSGRLNQIAYVDNWLVSTNLHPELSSESVEAIVKEITERFPGHAIGFRSVTRELNPKLWTSLEEAGFKMLASRPIFYLDTTEKAPFKARMFKSDLKLLKNTEYQLIDGSEIAITDISRIRELYEDLYLKKYSSENPQLTDAFIKLLIETKQWQFKAFRKDGRIDAVAGYFSRGNVMTSPLFGYDSSLPQELGLYRMISTALVLEAKEKGMILHQSSGAGKFKTLRRAHSAVEHIAVYTHHLPKRQRATWALLRGAMNQIGARIMTKLTN